MNSGFNDFRAYKIRHIPTNTYLSYFVDRRYYYTLHTVVSSSVKDAIFNNKARAGRALSHYLYQSNNQPRTYLRPLCLPSDVLDSHHFFGEVLRGITQRLLDGNHPMRHMFEFVPVENN